jgi:hypothetical protein
MKNTIIILTTLLILTSCFQREHKVSELQIIGNSPDINNQIALCLEEGIGYSSYLLKFEITLKDGTKFNIENELISVLDKEKKCFELYLGASFTNRITTDEEVEQIKNIYSGNVKAISIHIYDESGKQKISSSTFTDI